MLEILEIWFTPSGAAVTLFLVLLILFLCAFFVPSAQALIRQLLEKGVRGKWGSGQLEFGGAVPSKPAYDLPAGEAPPTPSMEPDSHELKTSEIRPTKVEGEDPNSESALVIDMLIASWSRDHDALEKAHHALMILPGRKQSDESLTTEKLSLEHRMGDGSAVGRLARLADANPDWYEPRQSLASIYYSLDSYDKASEYLAESKNLAQDDDQKLRSLLLDARILEKMRGHKAAIEFLRNSLNTYSGEWIQARIWARVAELCWNNDERASSFTAAEIALKMEPLQNDLRFQLAYRYAENNNKLLAYYHYDRLRAQNDRYSNCLNNMGIILEELDMTGRYVKLLKQAKEFDQPYPHGNLAITLAKAGFLDEARAMIEDLPEHLRLESRAADAAQFIVRKQSAEAKKIEKLKVNSELFHKIYLTAAINVNAGDCIGIEDVVGTWASDSCNLSLEGSGLTELVGVLRRGKSDYVVKAKIDNNLITGEAMEKMERTSFFMGTMTQQILLTRESEGRMVGLIYTDEMNPSEVALVRQE